MEKANLGQLESFITADGDYFSLAHDGVVELSFYCRIVRRWALRQTLKGPLGVLANHGLRMLAGAIEPRHEADVARVSHRHAEVAQPATIFRSLDRRVGKQAAEVSFRE